MFTTYVLRSNRGLRYIGSTSDLAVRLAQHNAGLSRFTSRDTGWRVVYTEEHTTRIEEERREKWLKTGVGRRFLDNLANADTSGS